MIACGKVYEPETELLTFEVPAGTELLVTPVEGYELEELQAEATFKGVLAEPLVMEETVIAPKGSPVGGTAVVDATAEGGYVPVGVELTSLTIHGGDEAPISTAVLFPKPPEDPTEQSEIRAERVLTFVLDSPATFSWTMDEPMEAGELSQANR